MPLFYLAKFWYHIFMFNKNIEALREFNPELAENLSKISIETAQESVTVYQAESEEPIIAYKDNYLDDIKAPFQAAKNIILNQVPADLKQNDIVIIYGMGLGYFFKRAFTEVLSKIVVFEPKIEVLRFVLEYIDFSNELKQKRVRFFNNEEDFAKYLETGYITNDKIELIYNPGYINFFADEIVKFGGKILKICESKNNDINTIKKQNKHWVYYTIANALNSINARPLSVLKGLFKDKNALILAAGPSLKDNIEKIKEQRKDFVIFAVNKIFKYLIENGIEPDFVVVADKYIADTIDIIDTIENKPYIITTNQADYHSYKKKDTEIFIYYLQNTPYAQFLNSKFPDFIDMYDIAGTSVSECYFSAVEMGFKNIVFAGLDLAIKNSVAYATGEAVDITGENQKITISKQEKNIVTVKSIKGENIYTRDDYKIFIDQLAEIFSEDKEHAIYNISSFGALIEGMTYKALDEIPLAKNNSRENLIKIPEIRELSKTKWGEVYEYQLDFLRKTKSDIKIFLGIFNSLCKKTAKIDKKTSEFEIKKIKQEEIKIMKELSSHILLATLFQFEILKYIEKNEDNKNDSIIVTSSEIIIDIAEQLYKIDDWFSRWIKIP